ncbi:MAG: restriction endonuclease [Aestuariivirga sp.]
MQEHVSLLIWVLIGFAITSAVLYFSLKGLQSDLLRLKGQHSELQGKLSATEVELKGSKSTNSKLEFNLIGLRGLIEEKAKAFPWLLSAKAEFDDLLARRDARALETKKHPAFKSAELVKEYRLRTKEAEANLNRSLYRQRYAEKLFPWLSDLLDEDLQQMISDFKLTDTTSDNSEDAANPAQFYLTHADYMRLTETERNQIALDRHEKSKKNKWQIGREFERYVGYLLESDNYDVSYYGATQGLEDLGRDLIATREGETLIVQCKYWSSDKTIHEKHVYQLYGTYCDYVISNNLGGQSVQGQLFGERDALHKVRPLLITTAKLSERAQLASKLLNVESESIPMERWQYPKIKCNISQQDGTKIYHLPFDQQYDNVKIKKNLGEQFATSCKEAEALGFRRAWKWKGSGE